MSKWTILQDESGQGLPEYALLVALVVVAVVIAASLYGDAAKDVIERINTFVTEESPV